MFDFDLSDELRGLIKKLSKRDRERVLVLNKKIKEIVSNTSDTIDRYKNCRYALKDFKRVHIDKSFVLLFRVYKDKNMVFFWKLDHHDNIY